MFPLLHKRKTPAVSLGERGFQRIADALLGRAADGKPVDDDVDVGWDKLAGDRWQLACGSRVGERWPTNCRTGY